MAKFQLEPGYFVLLSTEVKGGVSRKSRKLPTDGIILPTLNSEVKHTESTTITTDAKEYKLAEKARSDVWRLVEDVGKSIPRFPGLLWVSLEKKEEMALALQAAEQRASSFNETAKYSHVVINTLDFEFLASSKEANVNVFRVTILDAIRTIGEQIAAADFDGIRDTVKTVESMKQILDAETAAMVSLAIAQAREAANAFAKVDRARKKGKEIDDAFVKTDKIAQARAIFVDDVVEEAPVPVPSARALDVDDGEGEGGEGEGGEGEGGDTGSMAASA